MVSSASVDDIHSDASADGATFSEALTGFISELTCVLLSFAPTSGFIQYVTIVKNVQPTVLLLGRSDRRSHPPLGRADERAVGGKVDHSLLHGTALVGVLDKSTRN